jgi:hypothetical protein
LPGTAAWGSTFEGLLAVLWNPKVMTSGAGFGVHGNQFGFTITGTANIPIEVEGCADSANLVWSRLQTLTLTNGLFYFSEPMQTRGYGRLHRITFARCRLLAVEQSETEVLQVLADEAVGKAYPPRKSRQDFQGGAH